MINLFYMLSMVISMHQPTSFPPASSDLESLWELDKMNGNKVASSKLPTIEFLENMGRVFGNTGCNNFRGSYTVSVGKVTFVDVKFTSANCSDPTLDSQFSEALKNKEFTWEVSGGKNKLTLTSGSTTLVFQRTK
jgi:heat shock protein HslJ